jgi:hypothetical protein
MRRAFVFSATVVAGLFAAGCQDQVIDPAAERVDLAASTLLEGDSVDNLRASLDLTVLPEGAHLEDLLISRAINPADYACTTTDISDWYVTAFNTSYAASPASVYALYYYLADLIPTYDAVYFQTNATPQYFGYNGQYTDLMLKTDKHAKRFWDIQSEDIQLLGMHGDMLLDVNRVAAVYRLLGFPPSAAATYAQIVRNAMLATPSMADGKHPFFTFNAVAFSTPTGVIPDKIVMGDGILAGYEALGFADVAPQAIYAHEFAHHIQFERDYFAEANAMFATQPERTRYTELMADAMSAYFLTHKRGATMNQKRVEQFLQVFFEIGDCVFTSNGHHGTPNQRMAAARFGFAVAAAAKVNGMILTAEQFHEQFVVAYPDLIAPDAT